MCVVEHTPVSFIKQVACGTAPSLYPLPHPLVHCISPLPACRYISEDFGGVALHPVDILDVGSGRLLQQLTDLNLNTISPVNLPHPRLDIIISGSSRCVTCAVLCCNVMYVGQIVLFSHRTEHILMTVVGVQLLSQPPH